MLIPLLLFMAFGYKPITKLDPVPRKREAGCVSGAFARAVFFREEQRMIERKEYIARIKTKLDEWDDELEKLEQRACEAGGGAMEHWERHKMELQEVLVEMQERIDELRDSAGEFIGAMDGSLDQAWQRVSRDLEALTDRLFPGN